MAVSVGGRIGRSLGLVNAIGNEVKRCTLKPVHSLVAQYDPFHEKSIETRKFMFHLSAAKCLKTNSTCNLNTRIVCDRSDPFITINLESGDKIVLKSANLDALDLLKLYNKHVSSLAQVEKTAAQLEEEEKQRRKEKKKRLNEKMTARKIKRRM